MGDTLAQEAAAAGPIETIADLEEAWLRLRNAFDSRQYSVVTAELNNLDQLRARLGIANLPTYSNALLELAKDARAKSDTDLSARLVQASQMLSPDLPGPQFTEANLDREDPGAFLSSWIEAYGQAFKRFPVLLAARGYFYLSLALTLLVVAGLFAFALLYRHLRPLAYDVAAALHMEKNAAWPVQVGMLCLLLLPLAAGWAGLGAAALWITVFFPYGSRTERIVSPLVLLLLLTVAPLAKRAGFYLAASGSPTVLEVARVLDARWRDDTEAILRKAAATTPQDEGSRFALAFVLGREGREEEARTAWEDALKVNPNRWQSFNNMAVSLLRDGDAPSAQAQLQQGLSVSKDAAVLLYNLSIVREAQGQQAESQDALRRARAQDPTNVERWEKLGRSRPIWQRGVLANLSLSEINSVLGPMVASSSEASPLAQAIGTGAGAGPSAFVGLCLAILALLGFLSKKFKPASSCERCGIAIPGKIGTTAQTRTICPQCIAAFFRKAQVDPESRVRKVAEVERYQRRRDWTLRLLSLVIPGAGSFGRGRPTLGLIAASIALFIGLGAALVGDLSLVADPYLLAPVRHWPLWVVAVPIVAVAYLSGIIQSFRSGR